MVITQGSLMEGGAVSTPELAKRMGSKLLCPHFLEFLLDNKTGNNVTKYIGLSLMKNPSCNLPVRMNLECEDSSLPHHKLIP